MSLRRRERPGNWKRKH